MEEKQCQDKLAKLFEGDVKKEFDQEDQARIVRLAARTRTTMQDFLRRATERKIDRLSGLITESFRFLLRKKSMVERILIDPATFAITLYDRAGHALSKERLSEGEKQIFAISVLWGLARASNRPLPAVIDTPMARLDATHRRNLVEQYFPNASHQVVILSTDTEVDRDYYQALQPWIARAYHLNYDEDQRVTVAEEGYFWKESAHCRERGGVMSIKQIRLSAQGREQLIRLKTRTGITQWNILCRWAFCLSLQQTTPPTPVEIPADSNVEMDWQVFGGEAHELYLALLKERCVLDGLDLSDEVLARQFRLHLHRGIGYLATPHLIKSISDLVGLAMRECPRRRCGARNRTDRRLNSPRRIRMNATYVSMSISVEMQVFALPRVSRRGPGRGVGTRR